MLLLLTVLAVPLMLAVGSPAYAAVSVRASEPVQGSYGWFYLGPGGVGVDVNDAGGIQGLRLDFAHAYVWPHKGHDPLWIYYDVVYENFSNSILYFTCDGVTDPAISREWLMRANGVVAGYVGGTKTACSTYGPNWNASLAPGRAFTMWVLAHNVPWVGDKVSIEWQSGSNLSVSTPYFNPYAERPIQNVPAPRGVCPYDCS